MARANRSASLLALALSALALTACGGSNGSGASSSRSGTSTEGKPSLRATLVGESHDPVVGKNWSYTVTATDSQGHPVSGTVLTEFAFSGAVVGRETPPHHRLKKGHLKDVLQFPARSVGYPVELRVVVSTPVGSKTLNWPLRVRK